jgi:hypothetical protein
LEDVNAASDADQWCCGVIMTPSRVVRLRVPIEHCSTPAEMISRAKLSLIETPHWIGGGNDEHASPSPPSSSKRASFEYLRHVAEIDVGAARVAIQRLEAEWERQLAGVGSGGDGTAAALLYVGRKQGADPAPVFSNEATSAGFTNFVESLGDEVRLQGYRGYAGGLDTSPAGFDGELAFVGTDSDGAPLAWHTVPLLPLDGDGLALGRISLYVVVVVMCVCFLFRLTVCVLAGAT